MKTTLCAIAAAACAVVLTGCGADDTGAGSDPTPSKGPRSSSAAPSQSPTDTPTETPSQTPSQAPSTTPSTTPTDNAGTPECTNGDVTVSYRAEDHATSHSYGWIVLTNTTDHSCWVRGYGGISYAGDDGEQVGAPADRTPGDAATVTLAPGDEARSELAETSSGPYDEAQCRPTEAVALRVYIPDETDSQLVDHPVTACANPKVHLMEHAPYEQG
jgi:hypothetical protein